MKLNLKAKTMTSSALIGMLLTLGTQSYAGTMGPSVVSTPGKIYISAFGGAGASNSTNIAQYGTAFFTTIDGPLAVNAFGSASSGTVGVVGGHVGYQWSEIPLNLVNSLSGIIPATELEGYYFGKSYFTGHEINNITDRLPEHDFLVSYPMRAGVFLVNAVANLDLGQSMYQPYVGAGIGAGLLSISNADSTQVAPIEPGVNHYNSNVNSSDSVFAGQIKAGLNVQLTPNFSLFGEYRWLHLASSNHTFGSTVYPGHAATSSWLVKFDSQDYNLGVAGLRYTI